MEGLYLESMALKILGFRLPISDLFIIDLILGEINLEDQRLQLYSPC
jgi:hypothetical protein